MFLGISKACCNSAYSETVIHTHSCPWRVLELTTLIIIGVFLIKMYVALVELIPSSHNISIFPQLRPPIFASG